MKNCRNTNLCVEIISSKPKVEGKLGHMVQIRVNVMLLTSLLMDLCGGGVEG